MGCECCGRRPDIKSDMQNELFPRNNQNNIMNRKNSLSTNNSEDESDELENNKNNYNSNSNNENLGKNNRNTYNDNINIDEEKARNLVRILLENDIIFYKDLIPVIDNLSSEDFKALFIGKCEYDYKTNNKEQIQRLAHKFENFSIILYHCHKNDQYNQYLKEIWIEYPYLEDLNKIKDEKKISAELGKLLKNYNSWPDNIKQELIKIIKNTQINNHKIKEMIKKENAELYNTLQRLSEIENNFSNENDDEYLTKNNDLLTKDINTIYNLILEKTKSTKKELTEEDKEKIKQKENKQREEFKNLSPYLDNNISLIIEGITLTAFNMLDLGKLGIPKEISYQGFKSGRKFLFDDNECLNDNGYEQDDYEFDDDSEEESEDDYKDSSNLDEEQINKNKKEINDWLSVGKSILIFCHSGYQMFQTINLSKKIMQKDNEYRKELDEISEQFNKYQKSKRLSKNDPKKNLKIINESIDKIQKINEKLLNLIKKLKEKIDEKNNKKRGIFSNIIIQIYKIGTNIYSLAVTKDSSKFVNLLNIGLEISTIIFCKIDLDYTNDIIDVLIKILEEALKKKKDFENEIKSLKEECSKIQKAYPKYSK